MVSFSTIQSLTHMLRVAPIDFRTIYVELEYFILSN